MRRLSLRVRLTLAFALVMALVLVALGAFLYVRLEDSLSEQVDESLEARAGALAALVRANRGDLRQLDLAAGDDDGIAQLVGDDGSLLASAPASERPLVSVGDLARAGAEPLFLARESAPGLGDEKVRVLVRPLDTSAGRILVVGASLEDRDEALDGLLTQLVVVGPLALLVTSAVGYGLASAALRPVEKMRRRAAQVSSEHPGQRLPLSEAEDEIRRLGETLNEMLARLEAGLARERSFVADASHELRTPLAVLKTELELALRRPRSVGELAAALRSATAEVDRLTRLAEDLLVLARADEGRLPLRTSRLEAAEVLDAVAGRFASEAAARRRALTVTADGGLAFTGDRLRVEQALGNLVDNALRHGDGTVTLAAVRGDGHVELAVTDEGPGFSPEFLPRAFDRFARADEARSGEAAGLGLSIVSVIAAAHGGEARATNPRHGGATVFLALPD